MVSENKTTKSVPLRLIHPFFASGKVFTTRAFIGDTGRRSNLSFEALDRTGLLLLLLAHENMSPTLRNLQRLELLNCHLDLRCSNEVSCPVERFEQGLVGRSKVTSITECCFVDSSGGIRQFLESDRTIM
jgi:hypothetical protein